jgi:hypothetical protein
MFILEVESPSAIVLAGRASPRAGSRYHAARSFYDARGIAPKMR